MVTSSKTVMTIAAVAIGALAAACAPADRPEDFFKTDFDDSAWATAVAAQP